MTRMMGVNSRKLNGTIVAGMNPGTIEDYCKNMGIRMTGFGRHYDSRFKRDVVVIPPNREVVVQTRNTERTFKFPKS